MMKAQQTIDLAKRNFLICPLCNKSIEKEVKELNLLIRYKKDFVKIYGMNREKYRLRFG